MVAVFAPYHVYFINKVGLYACIHATEIVTFYVLYRKSEIKDTSDKLVISSTIFSSCIFDKSEDQWI